MTEIRYTPQKCNKSVRGITEITSKVQEEIIPNKFPTKDKNHDEF